MVIEKQFIQQVLDEKVRPCLRSHGGDISLQEITDDGYIKVKLTGACSACPGAQQTLSEFVETTLKENCPGVEGVVPVVQINDELINEALKILRRHKYKGDKYKDGQ